MTHRSSTTIPEIQSMVTWEVESFFDNDVRTFPVPRPIVRMGITSR